MNSNHAEPKLSENEYHTNFYSSFQIFKKLLNTAMAAMASKFMYLKMCLDLTNVSPKFQFDWPANNIIIAESLFSHFLGSLFSNFSKMLGNTVVVAKATKSLYLEDES